MIDRGAGFRVDGVSGVAVFPDDQTWGGFYALPDSPRIAADGPDAPQMRLMLYGRQEDSLFEVAGGLFTCTTSLGLYEEEKRRLGDALQERLTREAKQLGRPIVSLTWLHLSWTRGRSELQLTRSIRLTGQPSLFGDNACVFHHSLATEAAISLEKAWADGLPDSFARHELTAQLPPADFTFEGPLNTGSWDLNRLVSRVNLA